MIEHVPSAFAEFVLGERRLAGSANPENINFLVDDRKDGAICPATTCLEEELPEGD